MEKENENEAMKIDEEKQKNVEIVLTTTDVIDASDGYKNNIQQELIDEKIIEENTEKLINNTSDDKIKIFTASEDELRHFDVLDDLVNNQDASDSNSCSNDSSCSEVPNDEVDSMLDEALPDEFKCPKRKEYEQKEKLVLEEIGHNHFDILPEGWLQVKSIEIIIIFL